MHLAQLGVTGFRGIESAEIPLSEHTLLLGRNAIGKTAIVDAMALLLGRGRLVRDLADYDFYGGRPDASSRINIRGVVTGLGSTDPAALPELFNLNAATPMWWNPRSRLLTAAQAEGAVLAFEVGFAARFDEESLEVEIRRFFVDGETDPFQEPHPRRLTAELLRCLGFFLLPSSRTWDRAMSFSSELFRQVLHAQHATPAAAIIALRDWLRDPASRPEDAPELRPVVDRVQSELAAFLGQAATQMRFMPTSGDVPAVLQSLHPHLSSNDSTLLPVGRHGSGLVSLQTLLLLLEFGRVRTAAQQNFIIGAEEPELHLHPGHHRRLVARMRGLCTQSVTTTHSPTIAGYFSPHEILILRKEGGRLVPHPLLAPGEEVPDRNALLRLYTIYRVDVCEALMNATVLLPEGLTEFHWVKGLITACLTAEGTTPDPDATLLQTIGILPTQSSHVVQTYQHFAPLIDGIVPLVDGDSAGTAYSERLVGLEDPPPVVVQLPTDWTVENLVAWFIAASPSVLTSAARLLGLEAEASADAVASALRSEQHKSRWDVHEDIVWLVASSPTCAQRVAAFLHDVAILPNNTQCRLTWLGPSEDGAELQPVEPDPSVVTQPLAEPAVQDGGHSRHGQRGLGEVGGQDDAPPLPGVWWPALTYGDTQ